MKSLHYLPWDIFLAAITGGVSSLVVIAFLIPILSVVKTDQRLSKKWQTALKLVGCSIVILVIMITIAGLQSVQSGLER
jgi:hypothetical protein